jgi:hypothetical protein
MLGAAVALVAYVILRATFVSSSAPAESLNYYGIVAVSFLAGVVSRNVVGRLTEIFDTLFEVRSAPRQGSLEAQLISATHQQDLDRFHGYVVHTVNDVSKPQASSEGDGSARLEGGRAVRVWLQTERHPSFRSLPVDIGEGTQPKRVAFRINAFSEQCEIEPRAGQLVIERDKPESNSVTFVLDCTPGVERLEAFLELSQRGRTVAVVSIFESEAQDPRRQAGPGIGRPEMGRVSSQ